MEENIVNTQNNTEEVPERIFTQEEVNKIVSERLAKDRERAERNKNSESSKLLEELNARESRVECREYLIDNGYPSELIDCVDTSDVEQFKIKVEKIQSMQKPNIHTPRPHNTEDTHFSEGFEAAFRKKIPHKPAEYSTKY